MEQQRPLRLGDLVDDYCPRERRVTNHAIVALVEDTIRQTRCTTCESDHVYKGGKAPVRKKKDEKAALYEQVLANVTSGPTAAAAPLPVAEAVAAPPPEPVVPIAAAPAVSDSAPLAPVVPPVEEAWTLHRPLIRASLPRNDSQPPTPRAIPEFTMHQRNVRGSQHFRGGGQSNGGFDRGQSANGNGNGGGGYRGGFRADGQSSGQGPREHGQPREQGQPGSPNGQRPGGGRRRRRHKKPKPQV